MGSDAVLKSSHRGAAPVRDVRVRGALLAVWAAATLYLVYVAVHPLKHAPAGAVSPRRGATRQDARHAQASPLAAGAAVNGAVRPAVNWSSIGRNDATSPPEHPKDQHENAVEATESRTETPQGSKAAPPPFAHMLLPSPYLRIVRDSAGTRARYLDMVVHKGFTNQLFALLNGLAIAHLLNLTLVMPPMSANYEHKIYAGQDIQRMQFDPAPRYRIPASEVFDIEALRRGVSDWVEIVEELPEHLQGKSLFSRIPATLVNPKRLDTLRPYLVQMQDRQVLRIKCPLSSVVWNTPQLGQLRKAAMSSLAPGRTVSRMMAPRLDRIQSVSSQLQSPSGYIGLHLRVENDWIDYCKEQPSNPSKTQIESFEQCWVDPVTVAQRLTRAVQKAEQSMGIRAPRLIYVATGQYNQDFSPFQKNGFSVLSPANFSMEELRGDGIEVKRDLAAAVDYFIMQQATIFVGNIFSSFSFSVRETVFHIQANNMGSQQSYYYNDEHPMPLLEISPTEGLRWRVYPGIIYPEWYLGPTQDSISRLCEINTHRGRCSVPETPAISVKSVAQVDDGYITVNGLVTSSELPWIHTIEVNGLGHGTIYLTANEPIYKISPDAFMFEFSFPGEIGQNEFTLCIVQHNSPPRSCSPPQAIYMKPMLRRPYTVPVGEGLGTVFIYTGASKLGGGYESLHKLNAVINSEYAKGHIFVRSVLQNGLNAYRNEFSDFVDDITSRDVGPNDVFMVPERLETLPNWWHYVFDETGAMPMQYILGQHTTKLRIDRSGKEGFQSICLTQYFADIHGCPPKLEGNSGLLRDQRYRMEYVAARRNLVRDETVACSQENIILVDEDKTLHFDPMMITVPGAKVVVLRNMAKEEMVDYYRRAKINLDTYITGRERSLFEGALFNVIPVIKSHAAATDGRVFQLPSEWQWDSWDFEHLNRQLAELLDTYSDNVPKLQPLVNMIEGWESEFSQQVSAFFGDNVHIVLSALGDNCDPATDDRTAAMVSVVMVLLQYPFATVEVLVHNKFYFEYDFAGVMDLLFQKGMEHRLTVTQVAPEYQRLCSVAVFFQPPSAKQRRRHALLVPNGALPFEPDLITSLLKAYNATGCQEGTTGSCSLHGLSIEGGVLLVEQRTYYAAVDEALPLVPMYVSLARTRAYLEHRSIAIQEVPVSDLSFFGQKYAHSNCARYPLCSGIMQIHPWDGRAVHQMPPECLQRCLCSNLAGVMSSQVMAGILAMLKSADIIINLKALIAAC